MPNIFPPLQMQSPTALVQPEDQAPSPSVLGSVSAPSNADLAVNDARHQLQADTPQKYDYSAHSVLGNIGHVLGRAGNVAADILDPRVAPLIPGTDEYKQRRVEQDQAQLDKTTQQQQIAQNETDRVTNEQANRDAEQPLRDSEVAKNNAEANKTPEQAPDREVYDYLTKTLKMTPQEAYKELNAEKQKAAAQGKPDSPEQQYIDEYQKTHQGSSIADAERHYTLDTQRPPQIAPVMMMVPGANGSATATVIHPGQSVAPGTTTAGGFSSESAANQKPANAEEQKRADLSQNLNENLNQLEEIANRRPELFGPLAGRLTDAKRAIGTSDPDIAALDNIKHQLGIVAQSSHGMRSAQGIEGSANALTNSFHNTPEALKGAIQSARKSADVFINQANTPRQSRASTAPKSGDVEGGYRFKGGDPSQQSNWEKQ